MIIKLDKLRKTPCENWLNLSDEEGNLDVQKAFEAYGSEYSWLYAHSDYDLIEWQIQNNCFDWETYSFIIAQCCPKHFDKERFNWKKCSHHVVACCPQHFDKHLFNWENFSHFVTGYCPEHFDKHLFNWERFSGHLVADCPEHFDAELFNWKKYSWAVAQYCPELLHLKPKKI